MSNAGQAVLTIAGTIVGSYFGQPQLGYMLGSLAGQALFPTDLGTVNGPRLNDLTVMSSTIGAPIPLVYGSFAVAGNLIWSSGLIEEVSKTKQGGKGGPTQTLKEYTYSVNCAVGICEGPIGGIRRIWADSQLIYDARPRQPNESDRRYNRRIQKNSELLLTMNIYLGDEAQLPDPNIEAFEGVGNVSAFRGLAYVVFTLFQLENYGNRVPSFRFETAGDSTPVTVGTYHPGKLPYWNLAEGEDPRTATGQYEYNTTYGIFEGILSNNLAGAWVDGALTVLETQYASRPYTEKPRGYANWVTMNSTGSYRAGHFPCSAGTYPSPPIDPATEGGGDLGGKMQLDVFYNCFDNVPTYCLSYGEC